MSFVHYEERRQLRLLMISDLYQHIKQLKGQKPDEGVRVNKLTFYNSKTSSKQNAIRVKNMSKDVHNISVAVRRDSMFQKDPQEIGKGNIAIISR